MRHAIRSLFWHLLVACCWLMLGAGSAWATASPGGADEPAPLCGPDAASVPASDEIPEIDRGHFEALPCEAQLLIAGWRPDAVEFAYQAVGVDERNSPPPSPASLPHPRYEAAREVSLMFPERPEPTSVAFSEREGLAPSRGHARALFRPPVARA